MMERPGLRRAPHPARLHPNRLRCARAARAAPSGPTASSTATSPRIAALCRPGSRAGPTSSRSAFANNVSGGEGVRTCLNDTGLTLYRPLMSGNRGQFRSNVREQQTSLAPPGHQRLCRRAGRRRGHPASFIDRCTFVDRRHAFLDGRAPETGRPGLRGSRDGAALDASCGVRAIDAAPRSRARRRAARSIDVTHETARTWARATPSTAAQAASHRRDRSPAWKRPRTAPPQRSLGGGEHPGRRCPLPGNAADPSQRRRIESAQDLPRPPRARATVPPCGGC